MIIKIKEREIKMPFKSEEEQKEYNRRYYLKNRDRILKQTKKYRSENIERIKERDKINNKEWYKKNKVKKDLYIKKWKTENTDKIKGHRKNSLEKHGYKYEKTPTQIKRRRIRARTRYIADLENKRCSCGKSAECRHHTTTPLQIEKFEFMCNPCHISLHKKLNISKNERC